MFESMMTLCLAVIGLPLLGSLIAGFCSPWIGRRGAHSVALLGVGGSFALSVLVLFRLMHGAPTLNVNLYEWAHIGGLHFHVGLLIDTLSALMMVVVTSVSFMVHVYTIGYMHDDAGYSRFFSYISFFTFAMLMLVMANNFLQLFFGWEAVGLASYLLIGFWFKRESAIFANLKAFLVNRVGDFGFLLGIAGVLWMFGSLDYTTVFSAIPSVVAKAPTLELFSGVTWSLMTVTCCLLFIGAMGKSAQVPLHVWLPDSMEGPTPISALIHAATMVTAGIFLLARLSPLFEHSEVALNFVMTIGAVTCFFMGLLGLIQSDIKRIIAYSTLSQLGYMVTAAGASAYAAAMFHLMTHAFFKALLFLGAGSVILALHHQQDIRKMGGLWRKMPITYVTMVIGTLALIGFPFFSGFYSKDLIIMAVEQSKLPVAPWAHKALLLSVFVTSLYSFRLLFMVFHGKSRMDKKTEVHVHESSGVVTLPLCLLAIPSVIAGIGFLAPLWGGFFGSAIVVHPSHDVLSGLQVHASHPIAMGLHGFISMPFVLLLSGLGAAVLGYLLYPKLPEKVARCLPGIYPLMVNKYGFDAFNERVLMKGARMLGVLFWRLFDKTFIDGLLVNGSALVTGRLAERVKRWHSGYLFHYVFLTIVGVVIMMVWLVATWIMTWHK